MQDDPPAALRRKLLESLPHALARLFRKSNRAFGRAVRPLGITGEQAHVLTVLFLFGPTTMGDLMELLALSSGTLTGAVDRMVATGLCRRIVYEDDDKRTVRVEAAPWPKAKRERLFELLLATEDELFAALTARERDTLRALLARVLDSLK